LSAKYAEVDAAGTPKPRRTFSAFTVFLLGLLSTILLATVAFLGWALLQLSPDSPGSFLPQDRLTKSAGCVVDMEEHWVAIDLEQAENVSIIVGESIRRGLPPRAASIALVTAWQESALRNLDYGDLDSLGLFQQRPSQGWGTPEQIMNPWYAAGKFYDALVRVANWEEADITETAQAVQRSAYPDAYRKHEWKGRVWASTLTGWSEETITCRTPELVPGNAAKLTAFLQTLYGAELPIITTGNQLTITAPDSLAAWAIGQLAITRIGTDGVASVQIADRLWLYDPWDYGRWMHSADAPPDTPKTQVIITLNP
jgi:hypothetical protein